MPRLKVNVSMTKVLLTALVSMGRAVYNVNAIGNDLRRYQSAFLQGGHEYVREIKKLQHSRNLQLTLYRLRRAKYLKVAKKGRNILVALTRKGYAATLAMRMRQAPLHGDKFYTVVIFDIPESQRLVRRQLRLLLRQAGFSKLQQSVWVSKADVFTLMVEFINQVKGDKWVNVLQTENLWQSPSPHNNV
ncbi:MAG: CRISPR-associated endonuclease Cas2 [Patescibacteria group bacterium]